jgi:HD-GYP domain-containing protein (c-di-GMP phosphodiesterase class II)
VEDGMNEQSEYARITLAAAKALVNEEAADFEIYLPSEEDHSPVLYRRAGVGLSQPDFERMHGGGVPFLFVRSGDLDKCETILESKLTALLGSSDIRPAEKAKIVHQVGTAVARNLTRGPSPNNDLTRASHIIDNVIGCILNDPLVAAHMLHMSGHERTTASHMFMVSALAIMLGAEVFGPEQQMLTALGLAGMMHDIGKLGIDPKILNKSTPLTPEEMQLIQQHPVESVRLLGDDPHVTAGVRQMILQHHEWVNGRGYPLGVTGYDLFPGSRILSIVDSFHAMIGRRAYRKAVTPHEANRTLNTRAGQQFDGELLARWGVLFDRCWSSASGGPQTVMIDLQDTHEEVSCRHEHRPTEPVRGVFGPRAKRFRCNGKVQVRCVYAGRLTDATCAPDEFPSKVHDVSRSGLCMYSAYPMYRGEIVHLQIGPGTPPTWVRGVVTWCRQQNTDTYKVGLRFRHRIPKEAVHRQLLIEGITPPGGTSLNPTPATDVSRCNSNEASNGLPNESKRENAVQILEAIAAMRSVTAESERTAITMSASGDPVVRRKSIDVLSKIGSRGARQALVDLVKDDNNSVREHAVGVVGILGLNEASNALRGLLRSRVETTALRAAGALGRLGDPSGLPLVTQMLQREGSIARAAAQAFGEIVGHRFPANARGVQSARRYLSAKGPSLVGS